VVGGYRRDLMLPCIIAIEVVVVRNAGRRDSYEECSGPLKESHGSVRFVIRVLAIAYRERSHSL